MMTRQMKQTLFTGVTMFAVGIIFYLGNLQDEGLFSYILLVFGAWELGEVLSSYLFSDDQEEPIEEWEEMKESTKKSALHISIPMLTSMFADLVMVEETLRGVTTLAYLLTLSIYLLFIIGFTFFHKIRE